ncbi:T9SS type A sorting domain-containing protein [bacterium]|nr:T9SS type A sorting domain-containing protein [bacterium]MBU1983911.1 T9SS type A sorting domain-containing protein [bacterium]
MKSYHIAGLISLFSVVSAFAQPDSLWSNTFGRAYGDACYAVAQTTDGGYILGGYSDPPGGSDEIWIVKADANGDSVWSRAFAAGSGQGSCHSILAMDDGGCILVAERQEWRNNRYTYDFWLIRMSASGDSLWSRSIGGDPQEYPYGLRRTNDGGYVIVGAMYPHDGSGNWDMLLTKVSASGDSLWSRRYGGIRTEMGYSVQQTAEGGYIIAGNTESFGHGVPGVPDFWMVKTNANGDSLWSRTYGGDYSDECIGVEQTVDGGYVLAGTTASFGVATPGYLNFYLVRTNAYGDTLWTKTYGGEGTDRCESFFLLPDGGCLLGGITLSYGAGNGDMWLVRTDANGNMVWNRTFGGMDWDKCYSVAPTADGGYILGGETNSFAFADMWLVKTGPDGGGSSETTLLHESFDGSFPPAGWQVQQLGPATANWQPLAGASGVGCGDGVHSGTNAVYHNDDQGTSGVDVQDLLISPSINVPANSSEVHLIFFQRNCWVPGYYTDSTHHWVLSSVSGGPWTLLVEPNERQDDWAEISVAIAGAAGQSLRIGFHYQGDYATEWYLDDVQITARTSQAAGRDRAALPTIISLLDPYPNPFNGVTLIPLELSSPVRIDLAVFNMLGQRVTTLSGPSVLQAGTHTFAWDASGNASGMYLIRLQAENRAILRKALLLK